MVDSAFTVNWYQQDDALVIFVEVVFLNAYSAYDLRSRNDRINFNSQIKGGSVVIKKIY